MFSAKHYNLGMGNPAKGILGVEGEVEAAKYLESLGYRIIAGNFRERFGELDLVTKDRRGCLVFVEVKTMLPGDLKPEDQMTKAKISKFKKISEFFANAHPEFLDENEGWRIDVLCLTKTDKDYEIKHYENIV